MKIFNRGARIFKMHDIEIIPDRFTDIPEKHEAHAEKLLKDYPEELVAAEHADASSKARVAKIRDLETENSKLRAANEKLTRLLTEGDASKEVETANERAAQAEELLASERERLAAAQERITALELQLKQALQAPPTAPASETVPQTEGGPTVPAADAKPTKRNR